jgi:hypothetical protein
MSEGLIMLIVNMAAIKEMGRFDEIQTNNVSQ